MFVIDLFLKSCIWNSECRPPDWDRVWIVQSVLPCPDVVNGIVGQRNPRQAFVVKSHAVLVREAEV